MKGFPVYLALIFTFLLGTHEGFIALWQGDAKEPVAVFPYRSESLPLSDRQALEQGIRIETEADLARLLEDYLS